MTTLFQSLLRSFLISGVALGPLFAFSPALAGPPGENTRAERYLASQVGESRAVTTLQQVDELVEELMEFRTYQITDEPALLILPSTNEDPSGFDLKAVTFVGGEIYKIEYISFYEKNDGVYAATINSSGKLTYSSRVLARGNQLIIEPADRSFNLDNFVRMTFTPLKNGGTAVVSESYVSGEKATMTFIAE